MDLKMLNIVAPKKYSYQEVGRGERHGSYEWAWAKEHEGFTRFVVSALTQTDVGYRVEVWMGAEEGPRYTRRLVAQYSGVDLSKSEQEPLKSYINQAVQEAIQRAEYLTQVDLTEMRVTSLRSEKPTRIDEIMREPPD